MQNGYKAMNVAKTMLLTKVLDSSGACPSMCKKVYTLYYAAYGLQYVYVCVNTYLRP